MVFILDGSSEHVAHQYQDITMVFILDGSSEHVTRARRKICPRYRKPETKMFLLSNKVLSTIIYTKNY